MKYPILVLFTLLLFTSLFLLFTADAHGGGHGAQTYTFIPNEKIQVCKRQQQQQLGCDEDPFEQAFASSTPTTTTTTTNPTTKPHPSRTTCDAGVTPPDGEGGQGPFWVTNELIRQNLSEDNTPGIPLKVMMKIIDVNTCQIVPHAPVELWSADAQGKYSGFTGWDTDTRKLLPNSTCARPPPSSIPGQDPNQFLTNGPIPDACLTDYSSNLRGVHFTNEHGVVTFNTIIPGQYSGRSPHLHFIVWDGQSGGPRRVPGLKRAPPTSSAAQPGLVFYQPEPAPARHVGQLFFADDMILNIYDVFNDIYASEKYGTRSKPFTPLEEDEVWNNAGHVGLLNIKMNPNTTPEQLRNEGITATVIVYVDMVKNVNVDRVFWLYTQEEVERNSIEKIE